MKLKLTKKEKWNKKFVNLKEGARERGKQRRTEETEIEKDRKRRKKDSMREKKINKKRQTMIEKRDT